MHQIILVLLSKYKHSNSYFTVKENKLMRLKTMLNIFTNDIPHTFIKLIATLLLLRHQIFLFKEFSLEKFSSARMPLTYCICILMCNYLLPYFLITGFHLIFTRAYIHPLSLIFFVPPSFFLIFLLTPIFPRFILYSVSFLLKKAQAKL